MAKIKAELIEDRNIKMVKATDQTELRSLRIRID
jgi:hypothetical protein